MKIKSLRCIQMLQLIRTIISIKKRHTKLVLEVIKRQPWIRVRDQKSNSIPTVSSKGCSCHASCAMYILIPRPCLVPKKNIGINQCDLSIITITLLHKKELATMKPSTSMMSSPTSVATAARGTMDAVMANTSFSKVCLLTPKLKTQCCYDYKADECIRHRQYKIEQRSQIQAP